MSGMPKTSGQPELLFRYEIAFDRQFSRALIRLLAIQSRTPRQPIPYHPVAIGQTWKEQPGKEEEKAPLRNEPYNELKPNE